MDSSIIDLIIELADERLVNDMQNFIDASDVTKAGLIRAGLLQDDPTAYGISVLTSTNDPEDISGWDHSIVSGPGPNLHMGIPAMELGGSSMWFYRFTTKLTMFWKTNVDRDDATKYSNIVLQRALSSLRRMPTGLVDSYGNNSDAVYPITASNREGGGPSAFNWHGKIRWQTLVYMS